MVFQAVLTHVGRMAVVHAGQQIEEIERNKGFKPDPADKDYFNQYLFERGSITEQERNRMKVLISSRHPTHTIA